MINLKATDILKTYKRTDYITEDENSILLPETIELFYLDTGAVETKGLGKLDSKNKDLLRLISIENSLDGKFSYSNTYSPRTYAENLVNIPLHLTVQGLILCKASDNFQDIVNQIENQYQYAKTEYDNFCVTDSNEIKKDSNILIMNRRVGGWDGSIERPVIELLGAGGHVPTIFNESLSTFETLTPIDTIIKEAQEEIGISLNESDVQFLGGFHNQISSELVLLYGIFIKESTIPDLQKKSYGNLEENIDGLYVGHFNEVMSVYRKDASNFAGGEKAKLTNFPTQIELMNRIELLLKSV